MTVALLSVGAAALAAWLAILAHPGRPWDLQPFDDESGATAAPNPWPAVAVIVPARDEAAVLPETLPPLLAQDYPGPWRIVLVDDRSADRTAEVARSLGGDRVSVVPGRPLPAGWVGKVWAMEQGRQALLAAGPPPRYVLLTDADIRHAAGSLRRLVAESEAGDLDLNSRMARLRCDSPAERLLIPPFVLFFNLLYPMRLVNDPRRRLAAAAGGCVLVRSGTLDRCGLFEAIRGEVIDDVNLARTVKRRGGAIRLSVSRSDVTSIRVYRGLRPIWRMVRRSAFDQLRYSWLLLAGTVAGLALLFAAPPALVVAGAAAGSPGVAALGAAAWLAATGAYLPTIRYFRQPLLWVLTLPAGGLLYGAMTVDSALDHVRRRRTWS